ncbi:alpha/beta fold hydrolase [Methylobacterium sp. ID0610]|uniref:alpha/beta fold hydrolase n=1 Tax=Methylobacterium carpenticola TaxID=3344827 RepID=UPI0036A3AB6B
MGPDGSRAAASEGFVTRRIETGCGAVLVRTGGVGPAVLLLHGFPQTGLTWRDVAPLLARASTVVVADLPGYGGSDPPADTDDHAAMSKRATAATLVAAMRRLGHARFAIVGHRRGAHTVDQTGSNGRATRQSGCRPTSFPDD